MTATTMTLLSLTARSERDVFLVRQRGREVATALGFDPAGQVRLATALSEIGRHLFPATRVTTVAFRLAGTAVEVTLTAAGPVATGPDAPLAEGVRAAARLMDAVEISEESGAVTVVLRRRLPAYAAPLHVGDVDRIRESLAATRPAGVLDELGVQNSQLIAALEEAQAHRDELLRLNAELVETNQGVMALYKQLSDEMEQTNRGVVAFYAELDERSAQLREANEAKSRFLRNVSHELRAPVTAVLGMVRLLLDPSSEPLSDEQQHQLTLVQVSARDLLDLVNKLLDLAKAESNRLEPRWGSVDVYLLLEQLRGTLRPLASPQVELVVEAVTAMPHLVTDEVMLMQILRNLVTNGLKFTERGEVRLSVTYDTSARRAVFAVSDTGVGIAPAEHERVFEEFYQVRGAQRASAPGTGLGLPYARRLCQLLGADLTLASAPGEGTTFTVTLPRTPSEAGASPRVPEPRAREGTATGRIREVLVVDDDAAFRHQLRHSLEGEGMVVTEAGDGGAALAAIAVRRPDAVLLDLRMPVMGGLEMLGELAGNPALHDVVVIVVTAAELDDVARAATTRASAVLDKATLDDAQLIAALRSAEPARPGGP